MSTSAAFKTEHVGSPVPFQKCEKPANDGPCSVVPFQKGGNGVDARVCEHCGAPERPGQPVLDCWVDGDEYLLHRGCQNEWLAASDPDGWSFNSEPHDPAVPADSKVLGVAPGQRCEHCGAGRDVYLIILPGEQEPAPRHKHCAARYWETHSA